jgi:hypothetical protein
MNPIQGLQAFDPSTDPLGIGLKQRAVANQQPYQGFGPLPDPQWQGYFQAINEAGVDKFAGANPVGTNQLTGFQAPTDFSGTETYGRNGNRGPYYSGSVPGAAGAPNIPMTNPNRFTEPGEPDAPLNGLQAAAPQHAPVGVADPTNYYNKKYPGAAPMLTSTIQPLAGR